MLNTMQIALQNMLQEKGVSQNVIMEIIESGYILRLFGNPFSGETWTSVSDMMYGNKQFSSEFEVDKFIKYVNGVYSFPPLPSLVEYKARSIEDIQEILSEKRRMHYIEHGIMSFRGQTGEYNFKRKIPNPVRSNNLGAELSILPGVYRQDGGLYSFNMPAKEIRSLEFHLHDLEPNNPNIAIDSAHAYDIMRVEQHYGNQTAGLDITFDIESAIFFATHKFRISDNKKAYYSKVPNGENKGAIFCFCFRDPLVKKTEFLIKDFDLFKTFPPERILRQNCGLPFIGECERNIAITDIDCIIKLDSHFEYAGLKSPEHMFPNTEEDSFYAKLLQLKDQYPDELENIVEYEWAQP